MTPDTYNYYRQQARVRDAAQNVVDTLDVDGNGSMELRYAIDFLEEELAKLESK